MSKPFLVQRTRATNINRVTRSQRLKQQEDAFQTLVAEPLVQTLPAAYDSWFRYYFTHRPPEVPKVEVVNGNLAITDEKPTKADPSKVWGEEDEEEQQQSMQDVANAFADKFQRVDPRREGPKRSPPETPVSVPEEEQEDDPDSAGSEESDDTDGGDDDGGPSAPPPLFGGGEEEEDEEPYDMIEPRFQDGEVFGEAAATQTEGNPQDLIDRLGPGLIDMATQIDPLDPGRETSTQTIPREEGDPGPSTQAVREAERAAQQERREFSRRIAQLEAEAAESQARIKRKVMTRLHEERRSYDDRTARLHEDMQAMERNARISGEQLASMREQVEETENRLSEKHAQTTQRLEEEANARLAQLEADAKEARSRMIKKVNADRRANEESLNRKLASSIEDTGAERVRREEAERAIATAESRVTELTQHRDELVREQESHYETVLRTTRETEAVSARMREAEQQRDAFREAGLGFYQEAVRYHLRLAELENVREELDALRAEAISVFQEKDAEVQLLRTSIRSKEEMITQLNQAVITTQVRASDEEIARREAQNLLRDRTILADARRNSDQSQIDDLTRRLRDVRNTFNTTQAEADSSNRLVEELERQLREVNSRVRRRVDGRNALPDRKRRRNT